MFPLVHFRASSLRRKHDGTKQFAGPLAYRSFYPVSTSSTKSAHVVERSTVNCSHVQPDGTAAAAPWLHTWLDRVRDGVVGAVSSSAGQNN